MSNYFRKSDILSMKLESLNALIEEKNVAIEQGYTHHVDAIENEIEEVRSALIELDTHKTIYMGKERRKHTEV